MKPLILTVGALFATGCVFVIPNVKGTELSVPKGGKGQLVAFEKTAMAKMGRVPEALPNGDVLLIEGDSTRTILVRRSATLEPVWARTVSTDSEVGTAELAVSGERAVTLSVKGGPSIWDSSPREFEVRGFDLATGAPTGKVQFSHESGGLEPEAYVRSLRSHKSYEPQTVPRSDGVRSPDHRKLMVYEVFRKDDTTVLFHTTVVDVATLTVQTIRFTTPGPKADETQSGPNEADEPMLAAVDDAGRVVVAVRTAPDTLWLGRHGPDGLDGQPVTYTLPAKLPHDGKVLWPRTIIPVAGDPPVVVAAVRPKPGFLGAGKSDLVAINLLRPDFATGQLAGASVTEVPEGDGDERLATITVRHSMKPAIVLTTEARTSGKSVAVARPADEWSGGKWKRSTKMGTKSSQDLYFSHSATIMAFDMNCGLLWKKRLEKKRVPMRGSSDTAISAETRSDRVRALSLEQVEWLEYPKLMIRDFDGQSGRELSAQPAIGYSNISGMFGPWWMTWAGQHELVVLFRRGYSGISIARFSLMADKLTKTDIIAVARRNAPEVQKCKTGTEASGTIKVRLTVANTGQVTKATVQGTEFAGTPLAQCVEAKVGDFRFPTFRKGPMNFTLPFAL